MKQFTPLALLSLFMWGPHGAVDVEQTSYGFTLTSLSGGGITSVSRTATGYVIVPPNEPATFIDFDGSEGEVGPAPSPFIFEEVN
jgi:hypothetical protein